MTQLRALPGTSVSRRGGVLRVWPIPMGVRVPSMRLVAATIASCCPRMPVVQLSARLRSTALQSWEALTGLCGSEPCASNPR